MSTTPDPLSRVPDAATIREMIAANVRRTQLLRQLLRLSLRRDAKRPPAPTDTRKAVSRG